MSDIFHHHRTVAPPHRSRNRPSAGHAGVGGRAGSGRAGVQRRRARRFAVGNRFPQPDRHRGRVRQERRGRRCGAAAGIRVRRDRHRDAASATGQSQAETVPAAGRPGGGQPHGVQQRGPRGRAQAAGAPPPARDRRRQCRQEPRRRGRPGRLRHRCQGGGASGRFPGAERVLAQYAGPARLQRRSELARLLEAALAARNEAAEQPGRPPLLVKIAPDLSEDELKDIA